MKILFAASEVAPFAKTGGLADVLNSLPRALAEKGHEVAVFMPYYSVARKMGVSTHDTGLPLTIPIMDRLSGGKFFQALLPGSFVPLFLLENHHYYSREGIYNDAGGDYRDNLERYVFFCRAVLEFCGERGFAPDIIHCHDWQTALLPVYLKSIYRHWRHFQNTRSVFTIHNMAFQGRYWKEDLKLTGLPWDFFTADCLEYFDGLNLMKGGMAMADIITTVSPSYAHEIQTTEGGFGLEGIARRLAHNLVGIVNGVDYTTWDPATDPHLAANYHPGDPSGKAICKQFLQKTLELRVEPRLPLLAIVSRLTGQKGINLIQQAIEYFLHHNMCQFVLLGSGETQYVEFFRYLQKKYPDSCHCEFGQKEDLSHHIYAGADIFLMPSAYEPCGLSQLYSLKYGTVPLVRATGGLRDTIKPLDGRNLGPQEGTGFVFEEYSPRAFGETLDLALKWYSNTDTWRGLMTRCMREDWSWRRSSQSYEKVYSYILEN